MLLNSDNLKILLGNGGPRKKEERSATDALIKTIVQEEMCGKTIPQRQGLKKRKKKKKSQSEIEPGVDDVRMRLLMTNNLFDYAESFEIPFQYVDIIEKQFFVIRQNVRKTVDIFLEAVQQLYGNRSCLSPCEIIVAMENIGIDSKNGRELYDKLSCRFDNSPQSVDDDHNIRIHDIVQLLNSWATGKMLVDLLGHKYGFDVSWENSFEANNRIRGQQCGSATKLLTSAWYGNDGGSRTTDDLQSIDLSHSSSIYTNVRSLKHSATGSGKLIKSKSSIMSQSATTSSRSYASDLHALRQELEAARNGVDKLNKLVDMNIAWVQSNCDISHYASHFSSRAKLKCQKMAMQRIYRVFQSDAQKTLSWAIHRWKSGLLYETVHGRVQKYCIIKSIHILTVSFVNLYVKFLSRRWKVWLSVVRLQIRMEKDVAATMIQSAIRRYLSKVRLTKLRLGKTAVVIQNLFRKVKAVKVVRQKVEAKMNVYAAMAIQKLMKRLIEMRKAKAELKRRKEAKAAIKIQKVFRGMQGRDRFQQVQASMHKVKIAAIQASANPDIDTLAAAVASQEKVKKKKTLDTTKIMHKVNTITARQSKRETSTIQNKNLKNQTNSTLSPKKSTHEPAPSKPAEYCDAKLVPKKSVLKSATAKTPRVVETAEIEIQTDDFEWTSPEPAKDVSETTNDESNCVPNVVVENSAGIAPSVSESETPHIVNSNVQSDQDDDISVGSSIKSKVSDEAAVLIQKVARGKIARKSTKRLVDSHQKASEKRSKTIKSSDRSKKVESAEAVTKIQKIARGKLARSVTKKIQEKERLISQPSSTHVPILPVDSVADKDGHHDKSGNGTARSGKSGRIPSPTESSMAIKSGRSSCISERVVEVNDQEPDAECFEFRLEIISPSPDNREEPAANYQHDKCLGNQMDSLEGDPPQYDAENHMVASDSETVALHDDIPAQISMLFNHIEKSSSTVELQAKKEDDTTSNLQPKGLLPDISNGCTSPSFVKNSLGLISEDPSSLNRPDTTNSLERQPKDIGKASSGNNAKPNTAPMKTHTLDNNETIKDVVNHFKDVATTVVEPLIAVGQNDIKIIDCAATYPKLNHLTPKDRAAIVIQQMIRSKLAKIKVNGRRRKVITSQKQIVALINWAVISLQRVARGRQGRKRFHQKDVLQKSILVKQQHFSAIKLQALIRRFLSKRRVKALRSKEQAKRKQQEWLESLTKMPIVPVILNDENESEPTNHDDAITEKAEEHLKGPKNYATIPFDDAKLQEIDSKLKMLEEIERRIKESEEKVRQEALRAEERLHEQIRLLEEKTRQAEAERLAREELMKLAVGPVSHRSPFSTHGTIGRAPNSARHGTKSAFSTISSAPPTGRSAKDGPLPANAPRLFFGGQEWVQLWDQEQHAHYWWCEKTQLAQWEQPGIATVHDEHDRDDAVSESGYESTGGMTDYSTDHEENFNGSEAGELDGWTEYWDEQAQAKYWYNNRTGEASWTMPESMQSATSSISGSTASRPGYGNGWTSYIDDETGQMYWHNIETGEVQWDY